ncbi:MAG: hypothetical protein QM723_21770 [Myxococcaceae bacterium]
MRRRWVALIAAVLLLAGAGLWRWKHPPRRWSCIDESRVGDVDIFQRARYAQEDLISIRVHWDEKTGGAEALGSRELRNKVLTREEAKAVAKKIVASIEAPYNPATVDQGRTDVSVRLNCGAGESAAFEVNAPTNDPRFPVSDCLPGAKRVDGYDGVFECVHRWEIYKYEIDVDPRADVVAAAIRQQTEVLKAAPDAPP